MDYLNQVVRSVFLVSLLLLLMLSCVSCSVTVAENTYVRGSIALSSSEEFIVSSKIEWRYYQFSFDISSNENSSREAVVSSIKSFEDPVALLSLHCGSTKKERYVFNNVTLSLFHRDYACSTEDTQFIVKNLVLSAIQYAIIVQRMDDISSSLQLNTVVENSISGYSSDSIRSYRIYISDAEIVNSLYDQNDDHLILDCFSISLRSSFPHALKAYLSLSAYPLNRNRQELSFNETTQESSILVDFSSPLYSLNHDIYLILLIENTTDSLISYSLSSQSKNSLQVQPNTIVSGFFEEGGNCTLVGDDSLDAKGFAMLDLTSLVIYDDVLLTFMVDDFHGNGSILFSSQTLRESYSNSVQIDGEFPIQYTLQRNSSLYQLHGVVYMMLRIPLIDSSEEVTVPCSFTISSNYTQSYTVSYLDYDLPLSATAVNRTSLTYFALWIPGEGFGKIENVRIILSDIHYYWSRNGTVCTPLSLYISYNDSPSPSSILDSAKIKKEVILYYQTAYDLTIELEDVSVYMIIAIETEGTSSWTLQTPITINPYAPTPDSPVRGTVSTYETYIHSYIYLYVLEYTPIVLSATKLSKDYRSLILLVAIDKYPTLEDYDWREDHEPSYDSFSVNVTISRSHPKYCTKCKYYMTVYLFNATIVSEDSTTLSLDFLCSKEYCSWCSEGWDPTHDCKECLEGYYGTSCLPCPNCNHGVCFDRQVGDGTCTCDTGFTEASNCTDCANGFYGEDCVECPSCNNHGTCNDGKTGNGTCICDQGFDSSLLCNNCLSGYYGSDCSKTCLGNLICNGHGVCDDGIDGTGRCSCREGYVGIQCDTLYDNDKCNPHCHSGNGACDEEKGVCVCWDDHSGVDCNYNLSEMINLYILLSLVVITSIISFVFILRVKYMSHKKTKKQTERRRMVIDADQRTISWRVVTPTTPSKLSTYETLHEEEYY